MAGQLINGQWKTQKSFANENGEFKRDGSQFRGWLTKDGSDGPAGQIGFKAESERYHLYISLACPWAHRTLILHHLKELEKHITVSVVSPYMGDTGWTFKQDMEECTGDNLYDQKYLYEIYTKAKSDYTGKVTVPVLWDKEQKVIVSNESADIIRMFNTAFNDITGNKEDFYPQDLHSEINEINDLVYDNINNGVYKAGFATSQNIYAQEVKALFSVLDELERRMSDGRKFLCGEQLTEADIRLFTTLVRFDAVYHVHFKCNINQIEDYKFLQRFLERLYDHNAIKPTVNMDHIKTHYYTSHPQVNPSRIIPLGPDLTWYDDDAHSHEFSRNNYKAT